MKYTKDNPKLISENYFFFKCKNVFTGVIKDKYGAIVYFLNGQYHRKDGPAIEEVNGHKAWYLNDKRHREDGSAVECINGDKAWYLNGKLHREDGKVVEWNIGSKRWFLNNKFYGYNDDFTNESWIRFVQLELLK